MDAIEVPDDQGFSAAGNKAIVEGDGVMLEESLDIAAEVCGYRRERERGCAGLAGTN